MGDHPVVACWSGPDSVGALELGAALASALGRPLVVATAYLYTPAAYSARVVPAESDERRRAAAEAAVARARRLVDDALEVRERTVPATRISAALVDLARDEDAMLLTLGRDTEGRVTREVLRDAPCPVAISPYTVALPPAPPLLRLGVADDGSRCATLARVVGDALAVATGGRVDALTAPEADDAGHWLVEQSKDYDLLLCGSRGRGRFAAAILGSVSGRLIAGAHCPVVVVPQRARRTAVSPLGLSTGAGLFR